MKRFYKFVTIDKSNNTPVLKLDQKTMRTPSGAEFIIPDELESLILNEWASVQDEIEPTKMIATQLAITCQDLYTQKNSDWYNEIISYLETDYLCYLSTTPPDFAQKQYAAFTSILNKIETAFNIKIPTSTNLDAVKHNEQTLKTIETIWVNLSPLYQTAFYLTVLETGSTLLTLALFKKLISSSDVYNTVFIDEIHKGEIYRDDIYGASPDVEKKQNAVEKFLNVVQTMIQYLSM